MSAPAHTRAERKAHRREMLLNEAKRLFAARGLAGTRLEDLGAAVGISGPAVYRHFANKELVLAELLVASSTRLNVNADAALAGSERPRDALHALIRAHIEFALSESDVITLQDRELYLLPADDDRSIRRLQRQYAEKWVATLRRHRPDLTEVDARTRIHALFGLLNSTPHIRSATAGTGAALGKTLYSLAVAALDAR